MKFFIVLSTLLVFAAAWPHTTREENEFLQTVRQYLDSARITNSVAESESQNQETKKHAHTMQQEGSSFRRVYSLDMTDPDQSCPENLKLNMYGQRRLCGRQTDGASCDSIVIPLNGQAYNEVRGRVTGLQFGSTDAFLSGGTNIDGVYVDGVSITHGQNPRKHVWTLGAGLHQYRISGFTCPGTGHGHPQPAFVANNYFCTSGNPDPDGFEFITYDIPLWSTIKGNCGSTCNNMFDVPFFCTRLPQTSVDDLEVRICANEGLANEDILVETIELYIM